MKKYILSLAACSVFTMSFAIAVAQKAFYKAGLKDFKDKIFSVTENKVVLKTYPDYSNLYKINFKAVRDFMTNYKKVYNEKWEILNDGYMASFVLNSVWKKNYYNKNGDWLYMIDQYDETKLPQAVRASVKSIYYDYAITIVQEVNAKRRDQEPSYFIHIKYNNVFKTIKISNDKMEEFHFKEE